jgi:hypothetical protein
VAPKANGSVPNSVAISAIVTRTSSKGLATPLGHSVSVVAYPPRTPMTTAFSPTGTETDGRAGEPAATGPKAGPTAL